MNKRDTILVKRDGVIPMSACKQPVREGYRFAGWYTSPDGKPSEEWLFDYKKGGTMMQEKLDSMPVKQSMRLYARWVLPKHIQSAEDFYNIRNDLKGWYVLDNDINIGTYADWEPIGAYESDYEMADGEWWCKAFKGVFDGQGYTIRNLNIISATPSIKALFGAVANGEIKNVKLQDCHINVDTPSGYFAPLVSLLKQDAGRTASVVGCQVNHADIHVDFTMNKSMLSSVTGLVAGAWNGKIEGCKVGGNLYVNVSGSGEGGELYVGGILGEGYSDTKGCSSSMNLTAHVTAVVPIKIPMGGLQASATNVSNSISTGKVTLIGNSTIKESYVGGLIGSERYGTVQNCAAQSDVTVSGCGSVKIGGIIGEFNKTYGMIGTAFGVTKTNVSNSYTSGKIRTDNLSNFSWGHICGDGQPEPLQSWYGTGMSYELKNSGYVSQLLTGAKDDALLSLHGYSSVLLMYGDAMKDILNKDNANSPWKYIGGGLPIPVGE
jgi:predicted surface-layer protein